MPTTYKDQFFRVDPGNPPAGGTALTVERAEFIDDNDNGQINPNTGDTFQGIQITSVWFNDTLTINVPGVGNVTYTGTTFYLANGDPAVFTPRDGQALQDGTFVSSTFVTNSTQMPVGTFGPTCFTAGAQIAMADGTKPVEGIVVGDLVETLDGGRSLCVWCFAKPCVHTGLLHPSCLRQIASATMPHFWYRQSTGCLSRIGARN